MAEVVHNIILLYFLFLKFKWIILINLLRLNQNYAEVNKHLVKSQLIYTSGRLLFISASS